MVLMVIRSPYIKPGTYHTCQAYTGVILSFSFLPGVCFLEALMTAINIAEQSGVSDLQNVIGGDGAGSSTDSKAPNPLASLPDITSSLLEVAHVNGPEVQKSAITLQKAALSTFQTWTMRSPGQVGLLLGGQNKSKKWAAKHLIVSREMDSICTNPKVKSVCQSAGLSCVGMVMTGDNSDMRDLAKTWCKHFLNDDLKVCACVFVPLLQCMPAMLQTMRYSDIKRYIYIFIYTYI